VTFVTDSHATPGAPRSPSMPARTDGTGTASSARGRAGAGGSRAATRATRAPGKKSSNRSRPADDTSSGAAAKSGNSVGRPITHAAPSNGPTIDPSPPITPIATSVTDSVVANV